MTRRGRRIAIIGGGPSGLFVFKRLVETGRTDLSVAIFEAKGTLGPGMPYSDMGANKEHMTNVSGNEIPELVIPLTEWLKTLSAETLATYRIDPETFTDFKVLPRLLFGRYLADQFGRLQEQANALGMTVLLYINRSINDIIDRPAEEQVELVTADGETLAYDYVVICTGHYWPVQLEGIVPGYFDSPYPPAKLARVFNHPIAIRGASLTAIDAIRTLARQHGHFVETAPHKLSYRLREEIKDFNMVMHTRHGLLPCIRFHLDDAHLSKRGLLSEKELIVHREGNDGFISLDFLFEHDFKRSLREKDPSFYARISGMKMEEFVKEMMTLRESIDPFVFFKKEYAEAEMSIRRERSVYWKEMLAVLSFAMNYPAKYFSAEDYQRLEKVLMPLISIVIAFVPQRSCEELIALHDAGLLSLVDIGEDSHIETHAAGGITYHYRDGSGEVCSKKYVTFVDGIGQPHLSLDLFPFKNLVEQGSVSQACLRYRSGEEGKKIRDEGNKGLVRENKDLVEENDGRYFLKVPGLAITDRFEAIGRNGAFNEHLYIMAVPYIGGFNPDYSGLDFCERASKIIVDNICRSIFKKAK